MCCDGSDLFLGLLAVLFPPVAVWVKRGICSADGCINIALCILGFIPGLLHAWYIISLYPDRSYDQLEANEDGTVRYYYITSSGQRRPLPAGQRPAGYGTLAQAPAEQFPGQQQSGVVNQHQAPKYQDEPQPAAGAGGAGEGSSAAAGNGEGSAVPPPSYADAVKGDHKVQDRD